MKYFSIILFISSYLHIFISPIFGQNFDFNRAYQDYLYTYTQYRQTHSEYVTAKNQYLTYKTLTAKNKALIATREMLEKRSEVLRIYLTALRLRLGETTAVIGYQANILYLKIDKEVSWLTEHQESLSSASTIEELLKLSAEFESRYPQTKVTIYQALGEIIKSKEANLYQKAKQLISATEEKILEIKDQDSEKAFMLEGWLLEAKNKLASSSEKQDDAGKLLQALEPGDEIAKDFHPVQFGLKESNQYLKEIVFYLKEIIQKIKYD